MSARDVFGGGVAVITGAGAGIGAGLARHAAQLGMTVVLADVDAKAVAALRDELAASGAVAVDAVCDVRDPEAVEALAERTYRETMRDLGRLRENVGQNPEIARDVTDLVREMGRIDPARFGDDPLLAARINSQIVAGLEQIELQLRRKVEEQEGGNVRSGASEPAPAGYSKSVAEYYKKLSDKQTK